MTKQEALDQAFTRLEEMSYEEILAKVEEMNSDLTGEEKEMRSKFYSGRLLED